MDATRMIAERRSTVQENLREVARRLAGIRTARNDWTDEEHDPEGFTLTTAWSLAEGSRRDAETELIELDRADARVTSGRFGICDVCGRSIPLEQLRRRPARQTCVGCATGH